jgi:hypothetical protein
MLKLYDQNVLLLLTETFILNDNFECIVLESNCIMM